MHRVQTGDSCVLAGSAGHTGLLRRRRRNHVRSLFQRTVVTREQQEKEEENEGEGEEVEVVEEEEWKEFIEGEEESGQRVCMI